VFDPGGNPRVFALPCGVDFPRALVEGLVARHKDAPPDHLARVEVILNTRRMERRVHGLFDAGPPTLLPQLKLVTDLADDPRAGPLPPALPALRRRLELAQLIGKLLDAQPDLAARASQFDLADSLADLIDEMQGEGVDPDVIRNLNVSDMSGHWARAQSFVGLAEDFVSSQALAQDIQARQRRAILNLVASWEINPPQHPILLAGSTGSRGTTQILMQAIARLPQGAVIFPGFDFDQPDHVWEGMADPLTSEDHPQYRFHRLMTDLKMSAGDILPWNEAKPPSAARNRILSLALRPAPVTDAWLTEGPGLTDLAGAMSDVTLVQAPSPRSEALTIALRLRQAAETGQTAALITPDRMLTRQVSAALDRWNIVPDDSAGQPLQLSPPGRFLRHIAELFCAPLTGEALLTLLKHPLTHGGAARGDHLRLTRELELELRRNGPPFPDGTSFARFGTKRDTLPGWIEWLTRRFAEQVRPERRELSDWIADMRLMAEGIAAGSQSEGSGELWDKNAGQKALAVVKTITEQAEFGGKMSAREFADLLGALLAQEEVRDRDEPHAGIMIWGTLEARVQGADLVILGGLNEGSWPEATRPDPWLNRQLRLQAGLLLPERRIGLSAHDFQQAIAAPEVWLTRSVRSDEADTVASRWLNRLCNLLDGLPGQGGPDTLMHMRARGQTWLEWGGALEEPEKTQSAHRPSPRPPVAARPRRLTVTEIPRLIRDPYAVYAKHVLRLRPLDPLVQTPDALLRGTVLHEVLEKFVSRAIQDPALMTREALMRETRVLLEEMVPWPTARTLWMARVERVADDFLKTEADRQKRARPAGFELTGSSRLGSLDFTIACRADRVDQDPTGALHIFDYKTGTPPSASRQTKFEKQLLITAAMAEQGAFETFGPSEVDRAVFIGLGSRLSLITAPLDTEPPAKIWAELQDLISAYSDPNQGFSSRRMLFLDSETGDYDHLARFGEWDRSSVPVPETLT
jgi:ATP-dependent helicase/nuclease subunit B